MCPARWYLLLLLCAVCQLLGNFIHVKVTLKRGAAEIGSPPMLGPHTHLKELMLPAPFNTCRWCA
jgi:hypothetical protein